MTKIYQIQLRCLVERSRDPNFIDNFDKKDLSTALEVTVFFFI
jgi:hypothetical protein